MSNTIFNNITLTKKLNLRNKIIMYSGHKLPDGYVWCDGTIAGVPNLKDKFIYGIVNNPTPADNLRNTGTSEINYIPSHNHSIENTINQSESKQYTVNFGYIRRIKTKEAGGTRKGGTNTVTRKQHSHFISSVELTGNEKTNLEAEQLASNDGNSQKLADTVEINFNQVSPINNPGITLNDKGSNNNMFIQKYIYIGFIMKYP